MARADSAADRPAGDDLKDLVFYKKTPPPSPTPPPRPLSLPPPREPRERGGWREPSEREDCGRILT